MSESERYERPRATLGPSPVLRVENGRKIRGCRMCGQAVTDPRRRYWCGQSCVDRHQLMVRPAMLRGPCELCGLDADKLERVLRAAAGSLHPGTWRHAAIAADLARELMGREFPLQNMPWAQTDHRVPLVEGGGLEPENLRRLCVPCHRRETAALARRRADRRRGQVSLL